MEVGSWLAFFLDFYTGELVGDWHERVSSSRSHFGHGQRMADRGSVRRRVWQSFLAGATDLHGESCILVWQQSYVLRYVGCHARRHQW